MSDKRQAVWVSRIRELLDLKGRLAGREITPEDLAKAVGVSRQTIYTWMSSDGVPTLSADKAARLQDFFDVPLSRIWRLVDEHGDEIEGQQVEMRAG